jgi:hypothetical protein
LRELHDDVDALKEVIETRVSFNAGPATTVLSSLKRKRKTRKTRR